MYSLLLILVTLLTIVYGIPYNGQFTIFEWKKLEFGFPNDTAKEEATRSGNLIPTNAIPIDVQPFDNEKYGYGTFITIPKFMNGIPYSLAIVSHNVTSNGPVLQPYPNYEIHQNGNGTNCDAIISAFRMAINKCKQMWVIDSGVQGSKNLCPPKLLLVDLRSNEIIHRYNFNDSLYIKDVSLFVTLVVNVRDPPPAGTCQDTMIYIADVKFHGLVVYNYQENRAWRIENPFMYPDPNNGLLTVANKNFVLMNGISSMVTDKINLYFHPLSSVSEFSVPLHVIDNRTLFENNKENMHQTFIKLGERKSPCTASAIDSSNDVYCVTLHPVELIKWNANNTYNSRYFEKLQVVPEELEFVSGIKLIEPEYSIPSLWMLSNKFQNMATGSQNFEEINFRVVLRYLFNYS